MSIIEKAIDRLIDDETPLKRRSLQDTAVTPADVEAPIRGVDVGGGRVEQQASLSPELSSSSAGAMQGAAPPVEKAIVAQVAPDSETLTESESVAGESEPTGVIQIYTGQLEGIISPSTERSRTAEEFRIIKRPLLQRAFSGASPAGEHPNVIVVTSSIAGEGKTFNSLNLAISIAMELDRTVLLVDADLANPGLSRRLKIQDRPGLTERLLDEQVDLRELLLRTDVPKLTLLPAGRRHRRSTELLASNTMKGLLDELATRYPDRVVLFDSPPLLATSEASVLANQAGQIVLVVESGTTPQFLVKEAVGVLQNRERVSLVLNKSKRDLLSARGGYYYGYKYGYGYGYGKDNAQT